MKFKLPEFRGNRIKEVDPPGVIPGWLIRSTNAVAWVFVAILVATVFLRSLDIARSKAVPLEVTNAGTWHGNLAFYFPLFAPLVLAAIALPWTAKIVIPMFCSFDWRNPRHRWPKAWCAVLTASVAVVTMSSGFPLYHGAFNERFKQEAVKLEQADMRRAALAAEKQSIDEDLKALAESPNKYQAGAALAGAEAWAKRIATAEADNDPQLGMIKKALSDAERGDQLRKDRKAAIQALALAPTKASAMEQIKGGESYGSDALVAFINAWWGFALFIVIEMCALIAGWLAYMMQMSRKEQLAEYEASRAPSEADEGGLKIEDHSNEWQVRPQDVTFDENGDELIPVRQKEKTYYRRKAKKKGDEPQAPLSEKDARNGSMFDGVPEEGQNPDDAARLIPEPQDPYLAAASTSTETNDAAPDGYESVSAQTDTQSGEPVLSLAGDEEEAHIADGRDNGIGSHPQQDDEQFAEQASASSEVDAPLEAPDEQIVWEEEPEAEFEDFGGDDPQPEFEETDEDLAERMKGRGLPAPAEAAE